MSARRNTNNEFDVLGDILETLRFRGSIFFRSDLAAPWGISLSGSDHPRFHIVLAGACFVGTAGRDPVRAETSDIIVLPNGGAHWIADDPSRPLVPSDRAGKACELGNPLFQDGTITNRLMCGMVEYDQGASHPILHALPDVMHFAMRESDEQIWSIINLIDSELNSSASQDSRIADRLTEVLFLKLLKNYVRTNENATGFLAALRDRRVHHALALIHQEPEVEWTLVSLGERVGMSRATLVRRFQEVIGTTPMAYLANWRIMKAHDLVKHSLSPLQNIAEMTGFASARTLTKTFQRHYGCTPSALRKTTLKTTSN